MRTRMKLFKEYLEESQNTHTYRIKIVVEPTEDRMESIERLLKRYDLISVSTPQKISNPQKTSLEFRDIDNENEWYVDVSIGMPLSSYILQQELRAALDIPEKFIVVRNDNEPIEVESQKQQMLRDLRAKLKDDGYTEKASLLSTNRYYLDAEQPAIEDAYGDKYNKKFLNLLADIAKNRKNQEFEAQDGHIKISELKKVKQEPTQDIADFNANYDTPKPVTKPKSPVNYPVDPNYLTSNGNFDDDSKTYFTIAKNKNNKIGVSTEDSDQIRTPRKVAK